ncbi:MAG: alpha/beta fold hydrolase [Pseudomonadota bacterium]
MRGWRGGSGFPILLIHGSGPGAGSVGNWRLVLDDLARQYDVLAIDLIGFGASDRKTDGPSFDFGLWTRQAAAALEWLVPDGAVGVIGHSISAAIAFQLAADRPRINGVLGTGCMGAAMPVNAHLNHVWRCPKNRSDMATAARLLINDPALITDAYLDARMEIIGDPAYQAYFDDMFARPFADYIAQATIADDVLSKVTAPTILLHGTQDLAFPIEHCSDVLAPKIPKADLWRLANCSHSIAMERRDAFLAACQLLFPQ